MAKCGSYYIYSFKIKLIYSVHQCTSIILSADGKKPYKTFCFTPQTIYAFCVPIKYWYSERSTSVDKNILYRWRNDETQRNQLINGTDMQRRTRLLFVKFFDFLFSYTLLQTGRIMVWWCPSVRPSVGRRPYFLDFALSCEEKFAYDFVLLYYRSNSSVVDFRQSLHELCLFVTKNIGKTQFSHFVPTCFDILSWHFAYVFVRIRYRSSSSVVTFATLLEESCLFLNMKHRQRAVILHFSTAYFNTWSYKFAHDFV